MNTILITGTAQTIPVKLSPIGTGFHVKYNVNIWAAKQGEQIEFITSKDVELCGYPELWALAKSNVISYYGNEMKFDDGAYTQYLDHLIIK